MAMEGNRSNPTNRFGDNIDGAPTIWTVEVLLYEHRGKSLIELASPAGFEPAFAP